VSGTVAARAAAAAVAVARAAGLRVEDPVLLSQGVNLVVHLRPVPVVARVATWTPLLRPAVARPFTREVQLATALVHLGAPVVPPSDLLPPGPHVHDGLVLSFWRHVEVLPDRPTAVEAGRALGRLHEVLAEVDLGWTGDPLDTPFDDLAEFVRRGAELGADPALVERTGELAGRLRPLLGGPVGHLHGDAHPGNLLATAGGWRWTDLEDTSLGPRAWDLASLRTSGLLDGRTAVAAVPDPPTDDELAPFGWLRRLYSGAWWWVHAAREPVHRAEAADLLARAVAEVSAGLG